MALQRWLKSAFTQEEKPFLPDLSVSLKHCGKINRLFFFCRVPTFTYTLYNVAENKRLCRLFLGSHEETDKHRTTRQKKLLEHIEDGQ